MSLIERYVPPIESSSLVADAPGYSGENDVGPVCWKCRGAATIPTKRQKTQVLDRANEPLFETAAEKTGTLAQSTTPCPVCQGVGRLRARPIAECPGKVTRGRRRSEHTDQLKVNLGPDPAGYSVSKYGALVQRATEEYMDIILDDKNDTSGATSGSAIPERPIWWPQSTEELCNLTGKWRILQRVASHRWTTDDLVTAAVAGKELNGLHQSNASESDAGLDYCDLGTGNASVLQMILWKATALGVPIARAVGIEARSEAVQLARRSLAFNVGSTVPVTIRHSDFRSYCQSNTQSNSGTFDLVTGTPPYFRVDFQVDDTLVTKATIREGGMPTSVQSAPARCEFRGGFEAYCEAANVLLKPNGLFCVCENYQNHARALAALKSYKLTLLKLYMVEGKVGRGTLFCVYVVKKVASDSPPLETTLAVRSVDGKWTEEYANNVLSFMSIPCD